MESMAISRNQPDCDGVDGNQSQSVSRLTGHATMAISRNQSDCDGVDGNQSQSVSRLTGHASIAGQAFESPALVIR
jgi:hypothetical protein